MSCRPSSNSYIERKLKRLNAMPTPFGGWWKPCAWHGGHQHHALLDLLGLPKTTSNGRRIARPCARWDLSRSNPAASCRAANVTP